MFISFNLSLNIFNVGASFRNFHRLYHDLSCNGFFMLAKVNSSLFSLESSAIH